MRNVARTFGSIALLAGVVFVAILFATPHAAGAVNSGVSKETRGGVTSIRKNVTIAHDVTGDVQAVGGDVVIDARISGNVFVFDGNVTLGKNARITGDVVCIGGKVSGVTETEVAGEVFAPGSDGEHRFGQESGVSILHAMNQPFSIVAIALKLVLLLGWFVAVLILVLVYGDEVRSTSVELKASLLHSGVLGLVAFTSFILTGIAFSYLVPYLVGIPLLAALGVFAVLTKVYGMIAVFHAIGTLVAGARTPKQLRSRRWLRGDLAMTIIGLLILGGIRLIPVIGNFVWITASIFGVGVALATKFGRREPWFLAERGAVDRI